jgi:hypothetical protein
MPQGGSEPPLAKPRRNPTSVSAANLERLGASRLAALLTEHARRDKALRETLTRALAAAAGEDVLGDYIDRRIATLARGDEVSRDESRSLVAEVNALRGDIVDVIAPKDATAATGLLYRMAETGPAIARRAPPPREEMTAWQEAVLADLVDLWARLPPAPPQDVVELAVSGCTRDDGNAPAVAAILAPVLGETGLRQVRARLTAELKSLPADPRGGRWGTAGRNAYRSGMRAMLLRRRLGEIADLLGDVDGYIALEKAQPRPQVNVRAIVERLLKAGRAEEALRWLDDGRYHNRLIPTLDLRLSALEVLGREDDAQTLRWQQFERNLDRDMLREYLRRLPDFTDFEAERRAMEHVLTHKSATDALSFLIAWPDWDSAARLVRERHGDFGATPPDVLLTAVEALRERHPSEAVGLARLAVLSVLRRGLAALFERAARVLADCATYAPPAWLGSAPETHEAFVDRLRQDYRRHYAFWQAYDACAG